jgi:hypothetical protein
MIDRNPGNDAIVAHAPCQVPRARRAESTSSAAFVMHIPRKRGFTVRTTLSFVVIAGLLLAVPNVGHGGDPTRTCAKKKLGATAKKVSDKLKCFATAAGKAVPVDTACLAKAEATFVNAFAKAEAKGGCPTTSDAASVESLVDDCVNAVQTALGTALAKNPCLKAKLTAAAKKAASKIACSATAASKGRTADPICIAKVEATFAKNFPKKEAKGGCVTTGDVASVETIVDSQCVAPLVGALPLPTVRPSPTRTATPVVTKTATPQATATPAATPTNNGCAETPPRSGRATSPRRTRSGERAAGTRPGARAVLLEGEHRDDGPGLGGRLQLLAQPEPRRARTRREPVRVREHELELPDECAYPIGGQLGERGRQLRLCGQHVLDPLSGRQQRRRHVQQSHAMPRWTLLGRMRPLHAARVALVDLDRLRRQELQQQLALRSELSELDTGRLRLRAAGQLQRPASVLTAPRPPSVA